MTSVAAHVLIVGRQSPDVKGVRGPGFAASQSYCRAVERAGGVPLVLPPIPSLLDRLDDLLARVDAVVMHGGGDIDPAHYGEEPSAEQLYGIVKEHDTVELAVIKAAISADLPVLAICRGMQILNVALGGTLVQDIGNEDHWMALHPVDIEAGSRLAKALGTERAQACHSVHHQAVKDLGAGLRLTASAPDGTPEAIEVDGARWVIGVQWHPEDTAATDSQQQLLFDELLAQAQSKGVS